LDLASSSACSSLAAINTMPKPVISLSPIETTPFYYRSPVKKVRLAWGSPLPPIRASRQPMTSVPRDANGPLSPGFSYQLDSVQTLSPQQQSIEKHPREWSKRKQEERRWVRLLEVREKAREKALKKRQHAATLLQAVARGRAIRRPVLPQCSVCLESFYLGAECNGVGHGCCASCLAHLGVNAAERPLAHLSDGELRTGRFAIRCPCSAMGCDGFFSTATLDEVLQGAVANAEEEEAEALYSALVALARAQQPLSALQPFHTPAAPAGMEHEGNEGGGSVMLRPPRGRKALGKAMAKWSGAESRAEAKAARLLALQAAEAEAEGIRSQFRRPDGTYAAFMCGRCHHGPVEHYACSDLRAHHGEARGDGRGRISNGCPSCGWFSHNISDWPRWDGVRVGTLVAEAQRSAKPGRARSIATLAAVRRCASKAVTKRGRHCAPPAHEVTLRNGEWQCLRCTLVNRRGATTCQACELPRA